ncbi:uncharacterized protein Triagg1_353 [Trichoderma aggressivum f. europaeum]|uniref:Uncharacterized protein n=1 Tax=Trichoderma aggressivum f. europaeum TaxID=173218 RepID=A0AAE1ING8_9HYPO|nr:hypothetical protein Triagg1_353 [Trichoderma aggressivum f. europaeum]
MSHPWQNTHDMKEEAGFKTLRVEPSPLCARPYLSLSRHEGEREGIGHMGRLVRWHLLRSVVEVVSGGNSSFKIVSSVLRDLSRPRRSTAWFNALNAETVPAKTWKYLDRGQSGSLRLLILLEALTALLTSARRKRLEPTVASHPLGPEIAGTTFGGRRSEDAQRARATRSLAPAGPASAGRRARSGCFWLWAALSVARLAAPLVACAGRCAACACTPHCPTYKLPVARFSPPFLLHSSHFAPLPLSPRSHPWGEAESVIANSCIALASCWTASLCASDRPVDDFPWARKPPCLASPHPPEPGLKQYPHRGDQGKRDPKPILARLLQSRRRSHQLHECSRLRLLDEAHPAGPAPLSRAHPQSRRIGSWTLQTKQQLLRFFAQRIFDADWSRHARCAGQSKEEQEEQKQEQK